MKFFKNKIVILNRAVGRSENQGVPLSFGGHILPPLPPGRDRVKWSPKIWGCHGTSGIPRDNTPNLNTIYFILKNIYSIRIPIKKAVGLVYKFWISFLLCTIGLFSYCIELRQNKENQKRSISTNAQIIFRHHKKGTKQKKKNEYVSNSNLKRSF